MLLKEVILRLLCGVRFMFCGDFFCFVLFLAWLLTNVIHRVESYSLSIAVALDSGRSSISNMYGT